MTLVTLHITDAAPDRLARELAAVTRDSITAAIAIAIRARLDRLGTCDSVAARPSARQNQALDRAAELIEVERLLSDAGWK